MSYHVAKIAGLLLFLIGLALMLICGFYIYLGVVADVINSPDTVLKNNFGVFSLSAVWVVALVGEIVGAIWMGAGAIILSIASR